MIWKMWNDTDKKNIQDKAVQTKFKFISQQYMQLNISKHYCSNIDRHIFLCVCLCVCVTNTNTTKRTI